jgi:hypothetical protein
MDGCDLRTRASRFVTGLSLVIVAGGVVAAAGFASGEPSASRELARPASDAASTARANGEPPRTPLAPSSLEWREVEELFGQRPVSVIPVFADDRATAVWATEYRIWTRQATRAGVWKAARSAPHHVRSPGLIGASSDDEGTLTLVGKTSPRGDRYRIYAWGRPLDGSWTRPQLLASGPKDEDLGTDVRMSANSRGAILVTWIEPTTLRARALYRPSGGPWSKPVTFPRPSLFEGIRGTVGSGGRAVVTYPNSGGEGHGRTTHQRAMAAGDGTACAPIPSVGVRHRPGFSAQELPRLEDE